MDPYTGNEELDTLVRERMDTLAPEVKRVFDDPASSIYIESFGSSAGLDAEKTDALKHETILMMLGFTAPDDFSFILMTELEMPPRQAFAVEHWVKGIFLKEVMPLIESISEEEVVAPVAVSEPVPQPTPVYTPEVVQEQQEVPAVTEYPVVEPVITPLVTIAPTFAVAPVQAAPVVMAATIPPSQPVVQAPEVLTEISALPPIAEPAARTQPVLSPLRNPQALPLQPVMLRSVSQTIVPAQQVAVSAVPVAPVIPVTQTAAPVAAIMPKLPIIATPLPPPVKQIPVVPSIAPGAAMNSLGKATTRPHTMLEDVARVRGAITPAGVARYDHPLAQTPAYAK